MYVWEVVSCRLRLDGWGVWHTSRTDSCGSTFTVHVERPGIAYEANGPTLTEAYAVAARRAREFFGTAHASAGPHFARSAASALV
jgi:hypothetical protein